MPSFHYMYENMHNPVGEPSLSEMHDVMFPQWPQCDNRNVARYVSCPAVSQPHSPFI